MKNPIYLCGPIQGRSDDECVVWRKEFQKKWAKLGYDVLDPMRRDYRNIEHLESRKIAAEIVAYDLEDINNSVGLVVYFDRPSVGTSMEIFYAASIRLPVVVINVSKQPLSPWLLHHSTDIVHDIDAAVAKLLEHTEVK